ncbi:MAG: hypothetical protein J4F41_07355 [Alphaproteobacteria bacterium]|nr:hypothetical protein [Alphaproteobacteria bacterium]
MTSSPPPVPSPDQPSAGLITGSSGKSSSTPGFINTPTTLRSTSQLRMLAVVSAGPIEGLAAGLSSLRVDGVPVVSPADGSANIGGVSWQLTTGDGASDVSATADPGFNAVEQSQLVATTLVPASPYTRSGKGDAARLTFRFPQGLVRQTRDGIFGSSVELAIDVRQPDGAWYRAASPVISEKQTALFELQFTVEFTAAYSGPFSPAVRVTRLTAVSADADVRDAVVFSSITWITRDRLSYRGLSMLSLTLDAESFGQRVPRMDIELKGRLLRLPQNYDPVTRQYSGIWSGEFTLAYSNNPAWVIFDLLTDRDWGLGLDDGVVEIYDLYAIARYADDEVDDGRGGTEPRFTFDAVLSRRQSAYDLIQQICASVRVMMFWSGGRLRFTQDKPQDAVMWLTNHHVEDGAFIYSTAGGRTRYSHALVSYQDPDDPGHIRVEADTRPDVLAQSGYAAKEVALLGCRRASQARRHARWLLDKADAALHGVSWRAGLDHFAANPIRPGDVVRVVDKARLNPRQWSGRMAVKAPDNDGKISVQFDHALTITAGVADYETAQDGWQVNVAVTVATGDNGAVITADWPHPPVDQGAMVVKAESAASAGQDYRITALRELDRNRVEVDAIRHDNSRFTAIETGYAVTRDATSDRPDFSHPVPAATGLEFHQTYDVAGQSRLRSLVVAFTPPLDPRVAPRIAHWKATAKGPQGEVATTTGASSPLVLTDLVVGEWQVTVRAVDWAGHDGLAVDGSATVRLDPHPARPPTHPRLTAGIGQLAVSWDAASVPPGAVVEVLEYPSPGSTRPMVIEAAGSSLVLVNRPPEVLAYFRLRTRLRGGSRSGLTGVLSAAALPLPKDGQDGRDGQDGQDGRDGRDGQDGQDGHDGRDGQDGQDGQSGQDGQDGQNGTIITSAVVASPRWSGSAAQKAVQALRKGPLMAGDLVTLSTSSATSPWAQTRVYTATGWQKSAAVLAGEALADGTVPASRLKLDPNQLTMSSSGDSLTLKAVPAELISSGVMRSANFVEGSSGFSIDTAGKAEFNDTIIRGVLTSSRVEGSTLIAATSIIPTESQRGMFTLEQPRMMAIGQKSRSASSLMLGPFEVARQRHGRRFDDGGRVVLAAGNPFDGRDGDGHAVITGAGGTNHYYTRFWSDRPSIILDMTYANTATSGARITAGTIQVKLTTSSGRQIAASSVQSLTSLFGWSATLTDMVVPLRLRPYEGFALGSSGKLLVAQNGSSGTTRSFRLWMDLRVDFIHHDNDGAEDGLKVEVLLNLGNTSLTSAVLSGFYATVDIDASTQS